MSLQRELFAGEDLRGRRVTIETVVDLPLWSGELVEPARVPQHPAGCDCRTCRELGR